MDISRGLVRNFSEKEGHIDKCRDFYERYGAPVIHEKFLEYEERIAVGIVGEGSDCFGYDDEISRDHDYAIGFCMWLTQEDYECIGESLQREYERLIARHAGEYDMRGESEVFAAKNAYINGRRGVFKINNFYESILGIRVSGEGGFLSESRQWFAVKEDNLAVAVNGEVFRDDLGIFSGIRAKIMGYYPEDVWRRRLAEQIHIFSQNGQYNYARMMARKDYVTAEICMAQAMESAMTIVYLLNRMYAPYYKWKRKGMERLEILAEIKVLLDDISNMDNQKSAWDDITYSSYTVNVFDQKVKCIEKIAGLILEELRRQKIVDGKNEFLDIYCGEILNV